MTSILKTGQNVINMFPHVINKLRRLKNSNSAIVDLGHFPRSLRNLKYVHNNFLRMRVPFRYTTSPLLVSLLRIWPHR